MGKGGPTWQQPAVLALLPPYPVPTCLLLGFSHTGHTPTGHTQPVAAAGASPVGVKESVVAAATAAWSAWAVLCHSWPLAC